MLNGCFNSKTFKKDGDSEVATTLKKILFLLDAYLQITTVSTVLACNKKKGLHEWLVFLQEFSQIKNEKLMFQLKTKKIISISDQHVLQEDTVKYQTSE